MENIFINDQIKYGSNIFFLKAPLLKDHIYNQTLKNFMFHIVDGSWQGKAEIDHF